MPFFCFSTPRELPVVGAGKRWRQHKMHRNVDEKY
jgi:hypothetical protein